MALRHKAHKEGSVHTKDWVDMLLGVWTERNERIQNMRQIPDGISDANPVYARALVDALILAPRITSQGQVSLSKVHPETVDKSPIHRFI